MREEEVQRGLEFLRSAPVKDIPVDDRLKFLKEKLTQEEIQEVKRRFEAAPAGVSKAVAS